MSPQFAMHDRPNASALEPIGPCDAGLALASGNAVPDITDIGLAELGKPVSTAGIACSPRRAALLVPVNVVLDACSDEEVQGIATRRVIATVEDVVVRSDGSVHEAPHEPMREEKLAGHSEPAVVLPTAGASPFPALVAFPHGNATPEINESVGSRHRFNSSQWGAA